MQQTTTVALKVGSVVVSRHRPGRRGVVTKLIARPYEDWLISRRALAAIGLVVTPESAPSKEPTHARVRWTTGTRFGGGAMTCSATCKISDLSVIEE